MNLGEFCQEFRISLKKARAMDAAGVLRLDDTGSAKALSIRQSLIKAQPLTASQLVELIEAPGMILELGKYAGKAQDQVDAIGDAIGDKAPRDVVALISDAARGEPEAVQELVQWVKGVLPVNGSAVSHSWIAARILLGLPEKTRHFDVPRIPRALMRCRKSPDFAGWWIYGKKSGRKVSLYCRPDFSALDL